MDKELYDINMGTIREIRIYGRFEEGFSISVGQVFNVKGNKFEVSEIVCDTNSLLLYGVVRYLVFIKPTDSDTQFVWKVLENLKVEVTNDIV